MCVVAAEVPAIFLLLVGRVNQTANPHYTHRSTPKRVTSVGAHLRDLPPGQHSSVKKSQR